MDIREEILRNVQSRQVTASIIAEEDGIIAGAASAKREAQKLGLTVLDVMTDGSHVKRGDGVITFRGTPKQIMLAEEVSIGLLAKASGIATNAYKFVKKTGGTPKVVCGAWKKMPPSLKEMIRDAVSVGGASPRIVPERFAYLDKNYIEVLGGIRESLAAVAHLDDCSKVVQVKGRYGDIVSEACEAVESGSDIVFIDTGDPEDVRRVVEKLVRLGLRKKVKLAFGGGVNMDDIDRLKALDIDILDIGRPIVDAPILDMRMEVIDVRAA